MGSECQDACPLIQPDLLLLRPDQERAPHKADAEGERARDDAALEQEINECLWKVEECLSVCGVGETASSTVSCKDIAPTDMPSRERASSTHSSQEGSKMSTGLDGSSVGQCVGVECVGRAVARLNLLPVLAAAATPSSAKLSNR
jgi:hypothetical protein